MKIALLSISVFCEDSENLQLSTYETDENCGCEKSGKSWSEIFLIKNTFCQLNDFFMLVIKCFKLLLISSPLHFNNFQTQFVHSAKCLNSFSIKLLHKACTKLAEWQKLKIRKFWKRHNEIKLEQRKVIFYFLGTKKCKKKKIIISGLLIKYFSKHLFQF